MVHELLDASEGHTLTADNSQNNCGDRRHCGPINLNFYNLQGSSVLLYLALVFFFISVLEPRVVNLKC